MKQFSGILKSPFLWGGLASVAFYGLLDRGVIKSELLTRYLSQHPVEYVMTIMFFIGISLLVIRCVDLIVQYRSTRQQLLSPIPKQREPIETAGRHLAHLDELPGSWQSTWVVRRMRSALEYVRGSGSASGLEEELKYLSDRDAGTVFASYGLVRLIIWCIPIFGFLGTVIGIAQAIGELDPNALNESMTSVTAGLTIAFDTTAAALALSVVLSFMQFLTDRAEMRLLDTVDLAAAHELSGRFVVAESEAASGNDLGAVRLMMNELMQAIEKLTVRQAEVWQQSMDQAGTRYATMAGDAAQLAQETVSGGLAENVKLHAQELAAVESQFVERTRDDWHRFEETVGRNAESSERLQQGVIEQARLMTRVIDATGEISQLEDTLNRNLDTLADSGRFEDTVNSLAAAIHLLNGRLTSSRIDTKKGHAA